MSCPEVESLVQFASGHCSVAERALLERHLDTCVSCRQVVVELLRETAPPLEEQAAPTAVTDPLVGQKVGELIIQRRLGTGGMGVVYEALQPLINRRAAIKVLRPEMAQDARQAGRLLAEARAVSAVRHPGILEVFDFVTLPDGRQAMVMEFLEGRGLDVELKSRPVPLPEAVRILERLLDALAAAHSVGIVHRDIKPSNVFLVENKDGDATVKLLDFGLAKSGQPRQAVDQTSDTAMVGTPRYMAPEQVLARPVSAQSDLYSFGVMAYQMFTGRPPFLGTSGELAVAHVRSEPTPPREHTPELPEALEQWVLRLLAKDPAQRPESAAVARLELLRAFEPGSSPLPAPRRRSPVVVLAAAAAAVALGLGLALGLPRAAAVEKAPDPPVTPAPVAAALPEPKPEPKPELAPAPAAPVAPEVPRPVAARQPSVKKKERSLKSRLDRAWASVAGRSEEDAERALVKKLITDIESASTDAERRKNVAEFEQWERENRRSR